MTRARPESAARRDEERRRAAPWTPLGRGGPLLATLLLASGLGLAACEPLPLGGAPEQTIATAVPPPSGAYPGTVQAEPQVEQIQPAGPSTGQPPAVSPPAASTDATSAESSAGPADEGGFSSNMLSDQEAEHAQELALDAASGMLAAAADRDGLGATADLSALADSPTYRVMYSQRAADKDSTARGAEVAFYRYDTNEVVLTHVDLADGTVTPMALPPGYMAPLLPQEIAEAARAARADEGVRGALTDAGLDPDTAEANGLLTTVLAADTADTTCATSRCIRLFFFDTEHVVPSFTAIVDVSTLKVVEIAPMPAFGAATDGVPAAESETTAPAGQAATDGASAAPPAAGDQPTTGAAGTEEIEP